MQRRLINLGDVAQQRIGEIASKHRADLRDLARRAQPIEARGKRLLQGRRDGLNTALLAAFNKQARHLLDEQRHAAGALADPFDHLLDSACRAAISPTMRATPARSSGASEIDAWCERMLQGGRNSGRVVAKRSSGACAPRSASARNEVERRRVGPVQVLEGEDDRLRPRPSQNPGGHRRQLPSPQLLRREIRRAVRRQRNVDSGASRGRMFAGSRPISRNVSRGRRGAVRRAASDAKALPAPFGDWVQRRVLQKLRGAPFDPGVRRLGELRVELLDEPRLAEAGLADDQHELTFARARALPAARSSVPSSSSRPTKGVSARAPPLRPPPLARTMRKSGPARTRP